MKDYPELPLPVLQAYITTPAFKDAAGKDALLAQAAKILSSTDANTFDNELNKSAMFVLRLHSIQANRPNDAAVNNDYIDAYLSFQQQMKVVSSSEKPAEPTATTTAVTPPTSTSKKGVSLGNLPLVRNLIAKQEAAKKTKTQRTQAAERNPLLEIHRNLVRDVWYLINEAEKNKLIAHTDMLTIGNKSHKFNDVTVDLENYPKSPNDLSGAQLKAQVDNLAAIKVALLPIVKTADFTVARSAEIDKLKVLIENYNPNDNKESQQAVRNQIQNFVASPDYQQLKKNAGNKDNVADKLLLKRIDTLNSLFKQMDNTKKIGGVGKNLISSVVDNRILAFKDDKTALSTLESNKPTPEAPRASTASKSK